MKPAAWHEPNSYGKVTTHKKWALENGWLPLYAAPVRTKDLTGQDLCDLEIAVGWKGDSHDFDVIVHAVIAKFKEKNK